MTIPEAETGRPAWTSKTPDMQTIDDLPVQHVIDGQTLKLTAPMYDVSTSAVTATGTVVGQSPSESFDDEPVLYPDVAEKSALPARLRAADQLSTHGRYAAAISAYEKLLQDADDETFLAAVAGNNLAHLLATCDDRQRRDPARAVEWAEEALKIARAGDAPPEIVAMIEGTLATARTAVE